MTKKKFILLIVFLVAIILFQNKLLMPYIVEIVASDLFLEDAGDEKQLNSTHTFMTDSAHLQCSDYIANELLPDHSLTFSKSPLNAFSLGGYRYILNADLKILPLDSPPYTKRYACRIIYLTGNDTNGISNSDNWAIEGISGLDDI